MKLKTEFTLDEKLHMCKNMKRYGGSFVSALSEAILKADGTNLRKIYTTFPEECNKYANFD